jgi:hypothetical protein
MDVADIKNSLAYGRSVEDNADIPRDARDRDGKNPRPTG